MLSPYEGFLIIRGLKTLKLRVEAQNTNALYLAQWLEKHPEVSILFSLTLSLTFMKGREGSLPGTPLSLELQRRLKDDARFWRYAVLRTGEGRTSGSKGG